MSQFFDQASLVMVPSGYKTGKVYSQKPLSADGELTFTRSNDTATRVGSDGLIQRVRTNLVPDGLLFNTSTGVLYTTVTSDSPISGVNSTRITKNEAAGTLKYGIQTCSTPTIASNTTHTISRFFKYDGFNTTTSIESNNGGQWSGTFIQNIDIASTGVTLQAPSGCSSKITNVGSGWYRVDVTKAIGTVTVGGPVTYLLKVDSALSTGQGFLTAAAQLEVSDFGATDYILTTSGAVSVGPVANLPRLDYLGSSCGKLLLEPQRTNSVPNSENFNAVSWLIQNSSVTSNAAISPTGYMDADKLVENTSNSTHRVLTSAGLTISGSVSISLFAKKAERSWVFIGNNNIVGAFFNLENGTIGTTGVGSTPSIIDYGNGWYRCIITATAVANERITIYAATADNTYTYTGDGTSGLYIWGATIESSATYETSYINTLGAAVTRGQGFLRKTSISSVINSPEGTMFLDVAALADDGTNRYFSINDGTAANYIYFRYVSTSNNMIMRVVIGGVTINTLTYVSPDTTAFSKIALKWKGGDYAFWVNGVERGTDTTATAFGAGVLTEIVADFPTGLGGAFPSKIKQLLIFPTALTDVQLAELTSL
jgi:hypothetical protein